MHEHNVYNMFGNNYYNVHMLRMLVFRLNLINLNIHIYFDIQLVYFFNVSLKIIYFEKNYILVMEHYHLT